MSLSKKQRLSVLSKSGGLCWYCGCQLPEKGWHADHVDPIRRTTVYKKSISAFGDVPESIKKLIGEDMQNPENDILENMVPACAPCNLFKSVFTVEQFRKEIELQVDRGMKASVNFRTSKRFGLIKITEEPVVFWFEQIK